MAFYRTTITVTVLSEGPLENHLPGGWDLTHVHEAITFGNCSGEYEITRANLLTKKQMAAALEEQGSDPAFFGLNPTKED